MWKLADTIGLVSCILGTFAISIIFIFDLIDFDGPPLKYTIVYIFPGGATLTLGIWSYSKKSKIGIGGIILGGFCIYVVFRLSFIL